MDLNELKCELTELVKALNGKIIVPDERQVPNEMKSEKVDNVRRLVCATCGKSFTFENFHANSDSPFFKAREGRACICKTCVAQVFEDLITKCGLDKALSTVCGIYDRPFHSKTASEVYKKDETPRNFLANYFKNLNMAARGRSFTFKDSDFFDEEKICPKINTMGELINEQSN